MIKQAMFWRVAFHSLMHRRTSVLLTILSICVSVMVLLGVEHIRYEAKSNFSKTVSGVDLIIGARGGDVNLLLYSVFRIGNATNNMSWESYQTVSKHKSVAWTIPLSLGDSHQGYRVVGTTNDYFEHFKYGQDQGLNFKSGQYFNEVLDVVLGAEVAKSLGYTLDDYLVLAHGISKKSFSLHDDMPFRVVGILKKTGTPVDQALYVSLAGIEAIHLGWQGGIKLPHKSEVKSPLSEQSLVPKSITAVMVGLRSKMATFQVQRTFNKFKAEPLTAILPGVALSQLWQTMGVLENTLRLVSLMVLIASLLGLSAMLLASMRERENELRVLRTIGANPLFIFGLIQMEALLITLLAIALSILGLYGLISWGNTLLSETFGMMLGYHFLTLDNYALLGLVLLGALLVSFLPGLSAYRKSLGK
ncbi:MAG: putative ABC transport system permease protein [Oleiphilaceae bacterium]|jgi:putative ABC transport system permease protein